MKNLQSALRKIHEKTGLEMSLFTAFGEPTFVTGETTPEFRLPKGTAFDGNVAVDESGNTYLRVKYQTDNCYVVFSGESSSKTHALLVEQLLSDSVESFREGISVEEKMRMLLAGELNSVQRNMLRAELSAVKFNHYMVALITATKEMQGYVHSFLSQFIENGDYAVTMDERTVVLFRNASEDDGYRSVTEFASVLYENIKEEYRIDLTVATGGTIRSFHELVQCYEKVIFTFKFGKLLAPGENVYSYKDYVLLRLLTEVPKPVLMRCLDALLERNAAEVIEDEELMFTAEEFMKNSLNVSETSRKMLYHRNTLIHRLDRIEEESGLNLRVFNDAVTFRLIKILSTLIKGE